MDKQDYKNIAEMASNGDTKAFAKLYETIYREMYYTALYSLANDTDAVEAVTGTIRDGFRSMPRLKSESAFRLFMMKTLCARIRAIQKEYKNSGEPVPQSEVHRRMSAVDGADKILVVMYVAAKFQPEEIALYVGSSANVVRKRLKNALDILEIKE